MTDALAVIRRRLLAQGLAGPPAPDVAAAVRRLVAVQGQEWGETTWALSERTGGRTEAEVEAAIDRGDVQRTHVMRPTWHLVARDDARWLLRLTKGRVHQASGTMYRKLALDARAFTRAHRVFVRACADGPRTRAELAAAVGETDGMRMGYLLMHAELEEVIGSGRGAGSSTPTRCSTTASRRPRSATATACWRELGRRYFDGHGPATVHDLAKWATLTVADARAAAEGVARSDAGGGRRGTSSGGQRGALSGERGGTSSGGRRGAADEGGLEWIGGPARPSRSAAPAGRSCSGCTTS